MGRGAGYDVSAAAILLIALMLTSVVVFVPRASAQEDHKQMVIRVEKVVPSLGTKLEDWCGVTFEFLPDGRMICGELRSGKVHLIENNTLVPEPMVQVNVTVGFKGSGIFDEKGLVGLAIDPNFTTNHYVYLHYTYLNQTDNESYRRVSRFTMVDDKLVDEKILIRPSTAAKQHNGGPIEFGPDGKLYITGGENGKHTLADDPNSNLGKILRINPDGSIPSDNPIPGSPIYTMGHRNVFGITFHPITGRPYITENGNDTNDEINILYPGKNYGWPHVNGTTNDPRYVSPIYATGPMTIAPTEAEFYKGDKYPQDFVNDLFFVAYNPRTLERLELGGPDNDIVVAHESYELPNTYPGSYTDIELGPDGYFYVSNFQSIYKVYFDPVNATSHLTVTAPATAETAQPATITAKLTDESGTPLANLPISFSVSGASVAPAKTDQNGVASFQYTPLTAGEVSISARFDGNVTFASSAAETMLTVQGPSKLPPQVLEATTSDNFVVRMTLLPADDTGNNSTMKFSVSVVDPRSKTELAGIPYHLEIVRGGSILYSKDDVTPAGLAFDQYIFAESGAAQLVVRNVNNNDNSVTFSINIVPEFPGYLLLLSAAAIGSTIAVARWARS